MCYSYSSEVRTAEKRQPYLMEQHPAWLFFVQARNRGMSCPIRNAGTLTVALQIQEVLLNDKKVFPLTR
jgi:hypothetical protein